MQILKILLTLEVVPPPHNTLTIQVYCTLLPLLFIPGIFAEELFEVTSCYFPIDFRPPPNDPHGISTDSLIQGLRGCLAGTPKFAEVISWPLTRKNFPQFQEFGIFRESFLFLKTYFEDGNHMYKLVKKDKPQLFYLKVC